MRYNQSEDTFYQKLSKYLIFVIFIIYLYFVKKSSPTIMFSNAFGRNISKRIKAINVFHWLTFS